MTDEGDGMKETRVIVGCKINLFLRIGGRRQDGYHELSTLFLPLAEPRDELVVRPGKRGGLTVRCSAPGIDPARNTLTAAWERYARATGYRPDLEVELRKGIPHGAGLGGGSSDAAALLLLLQRAAPRPLPAADLHALAAGVGADVPFFLKGCPCRAEGIGDRLTPCGPDDLRPLQDLWLLLLCPDIRVNTARAFAAWDESQDARAARESSGAPFDPLTGEDKADKNHRSGFQRSFFVENSFEPVVFAAYPRLASLKIRLLQEGAAAAGMSGSGSALFGLFHGEETPRAVAGRLREEGSGAGFAVYGPLPAVEPGFLRGSKEPGVAS